MKKLKKKLKKIGLPKVLSRARHTEEDYDNFHLPVAELHEIEMGFSGMEFFGTHRISSKKKTLIGRLIHH